MAGRDGSYGCVNNWGESEKDTFFILTFKGCLNERCYANVPQRKYNFSTVLFFFRQLRLGPQVLFRDLVEAAVVLARPKLLERKLRMPNAEAKGELVIIIFTLGEADMS